MSAGFPVSSCDPANRFDGGDRMACRNICEGLHGKANVAWGPARAAIRTTALAEDSGGMTGRPKLG
jgi:hypothetical protein